jgi:AmiR/NasT family two-component response regulator
VREMPVLFLPVFSFLRLYPQQNYHPLFAPGTRLKSLREFCTPQPDVFNLHHKAVILSEAPRRSIAYRRVCCAESKDPGDACWQMLFGASRPRTIRRVKKIAARSRICVSPLDIRQVKKLLSCRMARVEEWDLTPISCRALWIF